MWHRTGRVERRPYRMKTPPAWDTSSHRKTHECIEQGTDREKCIAPVRQVKVRGAKQVGPVITMNKGAFYLLRMRAM